MALLLPRAGVLADFPPTRLVHFHPELACRSLDPFPRFVAFIVAHAFHLIEEYPELAPLLGLPPGYRFLKSGDYLDVWLDPSLLSV